MDDVVKIALDGFIGARSHWDRVYDAARNDIEFLSDKPGCQWDEGSFQARIKAGLPALQIDQLTQFVNQVTNDIRMNTPKVVVVPHSGGADTETAEIFAGKIRDIEHRSAADDAYDYAVGQAVKGSLGFIRVDFEYESPMSFNYELCVKRVVNPFAVYIDPASVEVDGSDAMCGWVIEPIRAKDFKDKYGEEPVSFEEYGDKRQIGDDDDLVYVCEYFKIEETPIKLARLPDGSSVEYDGEPPEGMLDTRDSVRRIVRRYHLSGRDVLKEDTFPGEYVPIIPVYGEEAWIDGERNIFSLFRKAKDAQFRYNYWASKEAEWLMKSTKATWLAAEGTIEGYEDDYTDPDSAIVLQYRQTDSNGSPASPPIQNAPPPIPSGIVNAMMQAADDIKATMGLYNSFLGQRSNETSGVAIQQRKMEGDRAVFHFSDNLNKSVNHVGRVLLAAIPHVYSDPAIVTIIGDEDEPKQVGVNGALAEGQERTYYLSEGVYNSRVTTGASFATMRQEAANFFQKIIQSQPDLMNVAGDLMFKFMDFPGASALAARMEKMIPPHLRDDDGQDPQTSALAQENQQLKTVLQQMQAELGSKQQENEQDHQIEVARLQLEERKMQADYQIKQAELALKARELALQEQSALMAGGTLMPQSGGGFPERV